MKAGTSLIGSQPYTSSNSSHFTSKLLSEREKEAALSIIQSSQSKRRSENMKQNANNIIARQLNMDLTSATTQPNLM